MLCVGPLILGHGPPRVMKAIHDQLARDGTPIFGAPHELEVRMVERVKRIFPFADAGRFRNSGLEATLHALRIAPRFTRKPKSAQSGRPCHGTSDEARVSLTPPVTSAGPASAPIAVSQSISTPTEALGQGLALPSHDLANTTKLLRA